MRIQSAPVEPQPKGFSSAADISKEAARLVNGFSWSFAGSDNEPVLEPFLRPLLPEGHLATLKVAAKELLAEHHPGKQIGSQAVTDFFATVRKLLEDALPKAVDEEDAGAIKDELQAYARLETYLRSELTDVQVRKYGPSDIFGKPAVDKGIYLYTITGVSKDGQVAGLGVLSSET